LRFAIVSIGIVLLAIVAFAWFVWLPSYRPTLRPGERYGIDVSGHQGLIEWSKVARSSTSFAYIKATEGATFVDRWFDRNWAGAVRAGLDRGAYHFFTLCVSGRAQSENFLGALPDAGLMLPPAVDLELAGNCHRRPPAAEVYRELAAFLEMVEGRTGQRSLLYVGRDFQDRYPIRSRYGRRLWVRHFLLRPSEDWLVWQVDGFAHVDGIDGRVDLDLMR